MGSDHSWFVWGFGGSSTRKTMHVYVYTFLVLLRSSNKDTVPVVG